MSGRDSSTAQHNAGVPLRTRSTAFADLITPGHPVTFLADGCQVRVGREGLTFDIVLTGSLTRMNHCRVGVVLEAIIGCAAAMNLSLRPLDELDTAGAMTLQNAARNASHSNVAWAVLDGGPTRHSALDRPASGSTIDPQPARRWWTRPIIRSRPTSRVPPRQLGR